MLLTHVMHVRGHEIAVILFAYMNDFEKNGQWQSMESSCDWTLSNFIEISFAVFSKRQFLKVIG